MGLQRPCEGLPDPIQVVDLLADSRLQVVPLQDLGEVKAQGADAYRLELDEATAHGPVLVAGTEPGLQPYLVVDPPVTCQPDDTFAAISDRIRRPAYVAVAAQLTVPVAVQLAGFG